MKNTALRVFIVAGLVLFGSLYYYSGEVEKHYEDNARRYLSNALQRISSWETDALKEELSQATLSHVSDEQLAALAEQYRSLGAFDRMDELHFSRLSGALSLFAESPRLSYSGKIYFEQGAAVMTATLTLQNQRFKLYNFNLSRAD